MLKRLNVKKIVYIKVKFKEKYAENCFSCLKNNWNIVLHDLQDIVMIVYIVVNRLNF